MSLILTSQYRTHRSATSIIEVLEELYTEQLGSGPNWWSPTFNSNYIEYGIKLTERPVVGQLIVITIPVWGLNISTGYGLAHRPRVGDTDNSFTRFNLACVGGVLNNIGATPSYQTSIWYRTVDSYDLTAWDDDKGYAGYILSSGAGSSVGIMTVTQLSRGQYWDTPIDSSIPYDTGSGDYVNSSAYPGSGDTTMIAGVPGVDVTAGGFVIASASRNTAFDEPSVDNSFALTSQQYVYNTTGTDSDLGFFTATRSYDANATNQNTTFTFAGDAYTATAIAAFNP